MLQDFMIQSLRPTHHNILANRGYPSSHPHCWQARDSSGTVCMIISRRDSYMPYLPLKIDVRPIGNNTYIDNSPAPLTTPIPAYQHAPNPAVPAPISTPVVQPVLSPESLIDSDVIMTVQDIKTPDSGRTIVVGEIFYFDSKLKNLQDRSLRNAFHEKAALTVTTHIKPYDFNAGHTYTFENLRDVSVSDGVIYATDARMPKP